MLAGISAISQAPCFDITKNHKRCLKSQCKSSDPPPYSLYMSPIFFNLIDVSTIDPDD